MPELRFTITENGDLQVEIAGHPGRSCETVQEELARLLGQPSVDRPTPEYHLGTVVRARPRPRAG